MNGLTAQEKDLMAQLNAKAELNAETNPLRVSQVPGNPPFEAQFDVNIILKYFTASDATGATYTATTAAAIAAALKTKLAAFVFGQSDFAAGFKKSIQQFPVTGGWIYGNPFVYGRDVATCAFGNFDSTVTAQLEVGDIVIPFTATTAGPVYTVGLVIMRCPSVGYAKMVDSLSSDRFWVNNIRYILTDTSAAGLLQYDNSIKVQKQSLFGLFNENEVSPTSFKQPQQFQAGIVDVPIDQGVDKNVSVNTYINYDSVNQKFSFFVRNFDRLQA